jgi:hypothetical protein
MKDQSWPYEKTTAILTPEQLAERALNRMFGLNMWTPNIKAMLTAEFREALFNAGFRLAQSLREPVEQGVRVLGGTLDVAAIRKCHTHLKVCEIVEPASFAVLQEIEPQALDADLSKAKVINGPATEAIMSQHELNIRTSDGWVVTLVSDKAIDLTDVILNSIIVQPVENFESRVQNCAEVVTRTEYRLKP